MLYASPGINIGHPRTMLSSCLASTLLILSRVRYFSLVTWLPFGCVVHSDVYTHKILRSLYCLALGKAKVVVASTPRCPCCECTSMSMSGTHRFEIVKHAFWFSTCHSTFQSSTIALLPLLIQFAPSSQLSSLAHPPQLASSAHPTPLVSWMLTPACLDRKPRTLIGKWAAGGCGTTGRDRSMASFRRIVA